MSTQYNNVYKGHRYVPKIFGEWNSENSYEGLSIVTYQGGSYTSKKRVPVGIDIKDTEFWAMTGNYNAQVEGYRQDVRDMEERVTVEMEQVTGDMEELETSVTENTSKIYDTNYIQDVTYSKHRDSESGTEYYITRIKHKDKNGEIIKLQNDVFIEEQKTIREFANEKNATVAFNAGFSITQTQMQGVTMVDGELVNYKPIPEDKMDYMYILGIKEDNTLMSFPSDTPISVLRDNGIYNAITAFVPLIEDGSSVSDELLNVHHMKEKNPRQVIAQASNKDILIMSTGGRGFDGDGMTASDVVRILFQYGAVHAHMLDGGGSTSTVVRGVQINHAIDLRGSDERKNAQALYIKKNRTDMDRDLDIAKIYKELGNVKNIADSKARRYNSFADDITELDNNWGNTIYIRMTETGIVHLYGSIIVGDKGNNQTIIIRNIPEIYKPIINVTGSFINANTPWETYNGIVVTNEGSLLLRGQGNEVPEGTRIHVNMVYKTNY